MRCNWRIPSRRSDSKESGQYIHEVPSSMLQDIKSQHTANMCPTKIIYQSNSLPCFNWTILGHYWPRWRFHLASHTCGCWWAGGLMITHRVYTTLRPRRNEQHFADDIFKRIFFNENGWISIKISLKFVRKGPINRRQAIIWTNDSYFTDAYMRHSASMRYSVLSSNTATRPTLKIPK